MPAQTVVFGVLYLGLENSGQQERYILNTSSLADGVGILKQIAYGRTAFFADGVSIDFARVSSSDSARDGIPLVVQYPLGPHGSWRSDAAAPVGDKLDTVNDPKTCAQQRFNTNAGKFWQRYYRYLPDSWVRNKRLADGLLPYFTPLPAGTNPVDMTGNAAHLTICQSFWSYLIGNTKYGQRVTPQTYNVDAFQLITFAQITSKKVGRRFRTPRGRLSVAGG